LCQKQTLRRVLDMIEGVGKVLKLVEHHHEISSQTISAFRNGRRRAFGHSAVCAIESREDSFNNLGFVFLAVPRGPGVRSQIACQNRQLKVFVSGS
jgi:hypothetical protein